MHILLDICLSWPREFQICGHFEPPTHRSCDTGHAQSTFWPWKTCLCIKFSPTNDPYSSS